MSAGPSSIITIVRLLEGGHVADRARVGYGIVTVVSFTTAVALLVWAGYNAYSWFSSPTMGIGLLTSLAGDGQVQCTQLTGNGQPVPPGEDNLGNRTVSFDGEQWTYARGAEEPIQGTLRSVDEGLEVSWRDGSDNAHVVQVSGLSAINVDSGQAVSLRVRSEEGYFDATVDLSEKTATFTQYPGYPEEEVLTCRLT